MSPGKTIAVLVAVPFVLATLFGQPTRADRSKPTPREARAAGEESKPRTVDLDEGEDDDARVADFMRRKLVASGNVLEGLVTEDFEMIEKGARTMTKMSHESDWRMLKSELYVQFGNEFRKVCDDLVEAADQENVDAAGLAYMRLTMGCITCHNYVRKRMMADWTEPVRGEVRR